MKYAVVKIGGSQYRVSEGDELAVEKLPGKLGKKLVFDEILLVKNEEKLLLGQPLVSGSRVTAKILEQTKDKKIRVATFKAKSRYRRVVGHRKHITKIRIDQIRVKKAVSKKKTTAKKK